MRWEAVPQLTRVRRQVQRHLLQLVHHHSASSLVAAELSVRELLALSHAADNRPHQEVWHVDGHWLRQTRELGCVSTDCASVASSVQW